MKKRKRLLALLLSLALTVSLCACGGGEEAASGDPGETASAGPGASGNPDGSPDPGAQPSIEVDLTQDATTYAAGIAPGETLLIVGGVKVKADLLLYWLAMSCDNFLSYYGMLGYRLTDDTGDGTTFADQMRTSAVNIASHYMLLQQKAAQLGCLPTDTQVQEARDLMMADGQESYDRRKAAFGLTDESMEFLYLTEVYYENVLNAIAPTATDEMLNNYVYQAKHILLKTVDTDAGRVLQDDGTYAYPALPAETVAAKKRQAEDILAQIQAADDPAAKFDELMNEFSEDGRDENGDLYSPDGYVAVPGDMVPGFERGALALKPGEISGLVESSYGYHIILRGEVADIESYAEDCRAYQVDQEIAAMPETANITRAPALDELDVAAFYDRYFAYYEAVMGSNGSGGAG